jgi:ribosome modulation factor
MNDDIANNNAHQDSHSRQPGQSLPEFDHDTERSSTPARQSPVAGWLGNSAADLLGPGLVLATQDQGYTAALNGEHVDTCPWRSAETDRDRALRQMWIRGYSAGRTELRTARDPDRPTT